MQIPAAAPTVVPPRNVARPVDVRPVDPVVRGTLPLAAPDASGRTFVSAASGIASASGAAWIVSDEYGELVRQERLGVPGTLHPGLARDGRGKPDLESVVVLPGRTGDGGSLLFAAGSGSSFDRNRGVVQALDATGAPVGAPRAIDLAPLYRELSRRIDANLNIEGLALRRVNDAAELLVFHRGKAKAGSNTVFRLDAKRVLDALHAGRALPTGAVLGHRQLDLGSIGGAQLAFSDARALDDGRIAFVASAEGSSEGPDGAILGSVVGMLDQDLGVTALRPLSGVARKPEGIERARLLDPMAGVDEYVVVTDPDAPERPAEVLRIDLA